jgi:transcription elongation factor SPT4
MLCSIILPQSEFLKDGCPNCEDFVNLRGSTESINECTSSNFNGCIALTDPEKSWVAKWMRLEGYVQGMYAVQVVGQLPEEVIDTVKASGVPFVPRDGRLEVDGGGAE